MRENGEIYSAGKNFTLPPAVTGGTNLNSEAHLDNDGVVVIVVAVEMT